MPMDKGNKRVSFRPVDFHQKSSHRDHDSGVGSSSSTEQASIGGRPDRVFTDQDRKTQRYSVSALQEALDDANSNVEKLRGKCRELDQQLSESNKKRKQVEALHRAQCDLAEQQSQDNLLLRQKLDQVEHQLEEAIFERDEWKQGYLSVADPVVDLDAGAHMMTAAGPSDSSDGPKRSKSKSRHDGTDVRDRLKVRMNRAAADAELSSQRSHHRHGSHSSSKKSRGRSSSRSTTIREPYIEEPPDRSRPPVTTRGFEHHYTTTAPTLTIRTSRLEPPTMSPVPRTPIAAVAHVGGYHTTGGDYSPEPLPVDPRKPGGRRH